MRALGLAEAEAESGESRRALGNHDRAIAESGANRERWSRRRTPPLRGEILLKQNPADPAPAEDAFLTAIAVAQHQKARSFELRAALVARQTLPRQPAATPKPTPCSGRRWKVFRRRRSFRRSRRLWLFWPKLKNMHGDRDLVRR